MLSEVYRAQVRLLVRTLPFVAEEECFALKGGTAINLFIRDLPASEAKKPHVIEFYLRPEMGGQVKALPAVLSDMYNPALRASTAESSLEVRK